MKDRVDGHADRPIHQACHFSSLYVILTPMSIDPPDPERQRTKWELNQESFEALLQWLNSDREQAGKRYEDIRGRLIKIFSARGCAEPDLLADETMNRVTRRVEEISQTYEGDPALYFYGVANKIHMEQLRKQRPIETLPPVPVPDMDDYEEEYVCLESCMGHLPARTRDLLLQYYEHEQQNKIAQHQRLADRLGIGLNALRIRVHRARQVLRKCIINCLEKKSVQTSNAS
jgi:DNA-directed RNA polymerase specialized sigma24 family protein